MEGDIVFTKEMAPLPSEDPRGVLRSLEERVSSLLLKYEEALRDRERVVKALHLEKERVIRLQKQLEFLTQDREKVKGRIDLLLNRLKGIDL
jgi:hypothetical protein